MALQCISKNYSEQPRTLSSDDSQYMSLPEVVVASKKTDTVALACSMRDAHQRLHNLTAATKPTAPKSSSNLGGIALGAALVVGGALTFKVGGGLLMVAGAGMISACVSFDPVGDPIPPARDGGNMQADGGIGDVDAGSEQDDAGTEQTDGGSETTDGGVPPHVCASETIPIERIPKMHDGVDINNTIWDNVSVSRDGRYIAFSTGASNLVAGDVAGKGDIFVYDRETGDIDRVSIGLGNVEANGHSLHPSLSADGRFVTFHSYATNLVNPPTSKLGIFLFDRQTRQTELVAEIASTDNYTTSRISPDGRYVGFSSNGSSVVTGDDTNGTWDVYIYDRLNPSISIISRNSNGVIGNNQSSRIVFTDSPEKIFFTSVANNFIAGVGRGNIFVKNILTGAIEFASPTWQGTVADGENLTDYRDGQASRDGRFIVLGSSATDMVAKPDTNILPDVYLADRQLGPTANERISVGFNGEEPNGKSYGASVNDDGRYVVFLSEASNLVEDDTNAKTDIFIKDRLTGAVKRVNVGPQGEQNNEAVLSPIITADGKWIVYIGKNIIPGTSDLNHHIYVTSVECLFSR